MNRRTFLGTSGALFVVSAAGWPRLSRAEEISLLPDTWPSEGENPLIPAGTFAKPGPWRIGHSHYGLAGSTHTYQTAFEAEFEVEQQPNVGEYLFRSADLNPGKQVADIEDLIAQRVDAILIAPLSTGSAVEGIRRAKEAGIPTVVYLGRVDTEDFTVQVQGDDFYFGRVMAEYLVEKLGNTGNVWVFRGVPGHSIDADRYAGAMEVFNNSGLTVTADQYGNWSYEDSKRLAESLYLSDPDVAGVWTDGANMSLGVLDALTELGASTIPPITGEALNGWMRRWSDEGLSSIGPICPPALSAAALRAAVALLEGKEIHRNWTNRPQPITDETLAEFYRPDLTDAYWAPTEMSDEKLAEYFAA